MTGPLPGLLILCLAVPGSVPQDPIPPTKEQLDFFEFRIRPVLVDHWCNFHAPQAKIIKGGMTFGETDHMGYRVLNCKIHIHDLHATMLHLPGIDQPRLTRPYFARDFRLTVVHGNVVKEILA